MAKTLKAIETLIVTLSPELTYAVSTVYTMKHWRADGGGGKTHAVYCTAHAEPVNALAHGASFTLRASDVEVSGHTLFFKGVNKAGEPTYACGRRYVTLVRTTPVGVKREGNTWAPMLVCSLPVIQPTMTAKPTSTTDGTTTSTTTTA